MSAALLIAPDSFKGTYTAATVARSIAEGAIGAGGLTERCPVADGGEGTADVLRGALGGREVVLDVHDPLGRRVRAAWVALDDGETGVVEMARASGLGLVAEHERDAERADTRGTGELIVAAARAGRRRIVVTVGGSATTDGGAGALAAIGAGGGLAGVRLTVLCDVTTPYEQAAARFGPQKGAGPDAVVRLTRRLDALARAAPRDPCGVPLSGAAGGLAGGLWAHHDARLTSGAEWVLDALGFDARAARADAVVCGEGRLDDQTGDGKIVGELARRCAALGVPLHAVVGSAALEAADVAALGLASVRTASTPEQLAAAGADLVRELASGSADRAART